jgi:hypothetical protein
MSTDTSSKLLLQSTMRLIDSLSRDNIDYDHIINVLSLICLISILNRGNEVVSDISQQSAPASNPIQKILGELTKGNASGNSGGPSPDMLMSLLPLLNNPHVKSKMTPSNLATILNLVNSLGGSGTDKQEPAKSEKPQPKTEDKSESPAAAVTSSAIPDSSASPHSETEDGEKKGLGRYLNWKTSF